LCAVDKFKGWYYKVVERFKREELREAKRRINEEFPRKGRPKIRDKGFVLWLRREVEDQIPGWKPKSSGLSGEINCEATETHCQGNIPQKLPESTTAVD
jgi:hypothetical protein